MYTNILFQEQLPVPVQLQVWRLSELLKHAWFNHATQFFPKVSQKPHFVQIIMDIKKNNAQVCPFEVNVYKQL